jgi:hypothetical protein
MSALRKTAAIAIIGTAYGLAIEAGSPDPQWRRVPVTGAIVIGTAALLMWAEDQLKEDG